MKNILLLLTFFSFCQQINAQAIHDPKRFYSDKFAFSMLKPAGWQVKENPNAATLVSFTDKSGASIDVILEEKPGETNLERYFKKNLETLKDSEGTKVGKYGKATAHTLPALWVIHSDTESGSEEIDYYFMMGGKGIIVSGSAASSAFGTYEKVFRSTAESLRQEKSK